MSGQPETSAERRARILARLSELTLELAEKAHAQAMAAETPDECAAATRGFERISRAVRLTLALEARLEADLARAHREDAVARAATQGVTVENYKRAMRGALWESLNEFDDDAAAKRLAEDLEDIIESEADCENFLDFPVETHIRRIRDEFGLKAPPPTWVQAAAVFASLGLGPALPAHITPPIVHSSA